MQNGIIVRKTYIPEITLDQILAFEKGNPETYTPVKLINEVLEYLFDKGSYEPRNLSEILGLESKHLSHAVETLTGMTLVELRNEITVFKWRRYLRLHPGCKMKDIAEDIGFAGSSAMAKFVHRNKHRYPDLKLPFSEL